MDDSYLTKQVLRSVKVMKGRKVYCKNCKHYYPSQKASQVDCYVKINEKNPIGQQLYRTAFCEEKNKNYNCIDYEKKWYLFWIKG
jgi:hypothetical protein